MSDAAQVPVIGVAQMGRDRVRVLTGLTTWPAVQAGVAALAAREEQTRTRLAAGERLADVNGLDLARFLRSGAGNS